MRIYRPLWVTKGVSPLANIVQDTAHAARSVQGLLPDLCHQAAFFAGGCRLPHWSDCSPPPRLEKVEVDETLALHPADGGWADCFAALALCWRRTNNANANGLCPDVIQRRWLVRFSMY